MRLGSVINIPLIRHTRSASLPGVVRSARVYYGTGSRNVSLAAVQKEADDESAWMERLGELLVAGGDTRCRIVPSTGNNAYHCPPLPVEGQIIRGSCTGSPPCARGIESALATLRTLDAARESRPSGQEEGSTAYEDAFDAAMDDVRTRLSAALRLPDGSGVILSASGTDVEFIPLAIAQTLYPSAQIRSVLVAEGETGSGGTNACAGKYFDKIVPLAGEEEGMHEREVGSTLMGLAEIEQLCIPAREADGSIRDVGAALESHTASWSTRFDPSKRAARGDGQAAAAAEAAEAPVWVLRQVLGSKTGFTTPELDILASVAAPGEPGEAEPRVIRVADFCQMRKPASVIRQAVEGEVCALITGSKFYQGSAFSAAVVVPPRLMRRLATVLSPDPSPSLSPGSSSSSSPPPPLPTGLRDFFSSFDLPRSLHSWRRQLGSTPNEGMLLRWHTALPLLEAVSALPVGTREQLEADWMVRVAAMAEGVPGVTVVHQEEGIVSICLQKPSGSMCGRDELKLIHRHLANDASGLWPAAAAGGGDEAGLEGVDLLRRRCFIGQPVGFTSEYAALRIAVGAECVLAMADGSYDSSEDEVVLRKLGWLLHNLKELQA